MTDAPVTITCSQVKNQEAKRVKLKIQILYFRRRHSIICVCPHSSSQTPSEVTQLVTRGQLPLHKVPVSVPSSPLSTPQETSCNPGAGLPSTTQPQPELSSSLSSLSLIPPFPWKKHSLCIATLLPFVNPYQHHRMIHYVRRHTHSHTHIALSPATNPPPPPSTPTQHSLPSLYPSLHPSSCLHILFGWSSNIRAGFQSYNNRKECIRIISVVSSSPGLGPLSGEGPLQMNEKKPIQINLHRLSDENNTYPH